MTQMLRSFITNPEKVSYEGKDSDEQVLYIVRKSKLILIYRLLIFFILAIIPFYALPAIIGFNAENDGVVAGSFITIATIFWYLICYGYLMMTFVNWYFNVFIITTKKIVDIDIHGLLYKNISEASLKNIEDVTSTVKGTFGMMFNIGDVFLQTAGETREFEFTLVEDPSKIRDIISDLVSNLKTHGQNN